jgi:hypothetical protein
MNVLIPWFARGAGNHFAKKDVVQINDKKVSYVLPGE